MNNNTTFDTDLNCPECQMRMKGAIRFNVEIDTCVNCYGIWFDEGEMRAYAKGRKNMELENHTPEQAYTEIDAAPALCPKCKHLSLEAGCAGELEMSRCENCKGIYLPFRTHSVLFKKKQLPEQTRSPLPTLLEDQTNRTRFGSRHFDLKDWGTYGALDALASLIFNI